MRRKLVIVFGKRQLTTGIRPSKERGGRILLWAVAALWWLASHCVGAGDVLFAIDKVGAFIDTHPLPCGRQQCDYPEICLWRPRHRGQQFQRPRPSANNVLESRHRRRSGRRHYRPSKRQTDPAAGSPGRLRCCTRPLHRQSWGLEIEGENIYKQQIAQFVSAIREDHDPKTDWTALKNMKLMEAIYTAAKLGGLWLLRGEKWLSGRCCQANNTPRRHPHGWKRAQ